MKLDYGKLIGALVSFFLVLAFFCYIAVVMNYITTGNGFTWGKWIGSWLIILLSSMALLMQCAKDN